MPHNLPHLKRVTAKGRTYFYFRTGVYVTNARGAKVEALTRLPDIKDKRFGGSYAAAQAARTKREPIAFLTIAKLIDQFQRSTEFRKLASNTRTLYDVYLRELHELTGDAPADDFQPRDVRAVMDRMGDRTGAANAMLKIIGALYAWGRGRQLVGRDTKPTEGVTAQDATPHRPWPESVLSAALTSKEDKVRLAAHLLLYTGQRIGDVMRMRWSDIRDGWIHGTQEKTGKEFEVPLHRNLVAELARTPKRGITILCRHDGQPMSDQTVRIALKKHCAGFGADLVPHGLRKNAVIALLEVGCSVAEVASITQQTLRMVEHYAKNRNQRTLAGAAILKWNAQ